MSLFALSLAYLRARPLNTCLNLLLLALGVGMIVLLMLFSAQLQQRLARDASGLDLVIGAKGSPLQLILSSIYHLDIPTGNIPITELDRWRGHELVESVIPLALGDSLSGFRMVGTEPDYAEHYDARLADGKFFQHPFEAVLGAEAAARTGLTVGDHFFGNHGLAPGGPAHGEHPYTVVGILTRTASVIDRLVLTSIDSIWTAHGIEPDHDDDHAQENHSSPPHDESHESDPPTEQTSEATSTDRRQAVTALLVRYRTPLAAVQLPPLVNQTAGLQAAAPALEMARLLALIGVGMDAVRGFALLLMATAGLSVFIALYQALQMRRYDLAVMRTLGASSRMLFLQLLLEGLILAGSGAVLGLLLGHGVASLLTFLLPDISTLGLTGMTWLAEEVYVIGLAFIIGLLAALIPAFQAYRTDITAVLASGQ